ncbi:RDD family protein [Acinetobacter sp. MB5]|uniref:RDD family protein n=1 Tax=Acinetobacter sp. MB5 TaxID=2069438 RepID=UPI000DCF75ED|nr:RDD family protein [Acinetobacter sp. MB5]
MQIYLARNNQQAGPYTLEQLNQMLTNQQVLLTDLAWHQGMTEWKPLGELTHGQLFYQPQNYSEPVSPFSSVNLSKNPQQPKPELAPIEKRVFAKLIDLLLWLPAFALPSFYMDEATKTQIIKLQEQGINTSSQTEIFSLVPTDAWHSMLAYIVIMLAIQAFFLAKSGQSIGKYIAKIQIVDAENNSAVGLTRVFLLRSVVFIILNLLFMPFITILDFAFGFGEKRQTLHDRIAKTKVINRIKIKNKSE